MRRLTLLAAACLLVGDVRPPFVRPKLKQPTTPKPLAH